MYYTDIGKRGLNNGPWAVPFWLIKYSLGNRHRLVLSPVGLRVIWRLRRRHKPDVVSFSASFTTPWCSIIKLMTGINEA